MTGDVSEVEAIARALHGFEDSWNDTDWEYLPEGTQNLFRGQARAAIAAMQSRPDVDELVEAAYRAGQENMRERAAKRASYVPVGDGYFDPWSNATEAVEALEIEPRNQEKDARG